MVSTKIKKYDLCIIGSGPAGITVAMELAYSGKRICVLESGKRKKTAFADALRGVDWKLFPIRPNSRERIIGGASSTWGGLSALLDPVDFSTWPLDQEEMSPYLKMVSRYRFPEPQEFELSRKSLTGWKQLNNLVDKIFIAIRPPFNFGSLKHIFKRENLDLFTDATVVELKGERGKVTCAICKGSEGETFFVEADFFVLAAGGIENPRILLNSNLGNEHDQVGRYFMNHPKGYAGVLKLKKSLPPSVYYLPRLISGRMIYAGLRLSEQYQREHQLLNCCVQFEPSLGIFQRYSFAIWNRLPKFSSEALSILLPKTLRLRWFADMEARSANRVVLGQKKDAFGIPIPQVSYSLGEKDKASLKALHQELKASVELLGLGELYGSSQEVISAVKDDASHHLGTTRMGTNPRTSVVDPDCKAHSLTNLYIAGGSVFPTAGCASPTLTIVALSIRLAEHLKKRFGVDEVREVSQKKSANNKMIIIGAGKRVSADVMPVIESLPEDLTVSAIFAKHSQMVFGTMSRYKVRPIDSLEEGDLKNVRFVYLSVPRQSVLEVIEQLPPIKEETELIIDTPVFYSKIKDLAEKKGFKRVHIAEDSIFLPWLPAVMKSGPIKRIEAIKSLYRYHGMALLKILGDGHIRWGLKLGKRLFVRVGNVYVKILEPRDYSSGKLIIDGKEVGLIMKNNLCEGFTFDGHEERIGDEESSLIGRVESDDTIVSLMGELKRVGLRRFIIKVIKKEKTWSVSEAVNDAKTDLFLHRFWLYFRSKIK